MPGADAGTWYLNLKTGSGSVGSGSAPTQADVSFTMKDADFQQMFAGETLTFALNDDHFYHTSKFFVGKLKPTAAFMSGKMKLKGDMGKAMKLEKLMGKMHTSQFHTLANSSGGKHFSSNNNTKSRL